MLETTAEGVMQVLCMQTLAHSTRRRRLLLPNSRLHENQQSLSQSATGDKWMSLNAAVIETLFACENRANSPVQASDGVLCISVVPHVHKSKACSSSQYTHDQYPSSLRYRLQCRLCMLQTPAISIAASPSERCEVCMQQYPLFKSLSPVHSCWAAGVDTETWQ